MKDTTSNILRTSDEIYKSILYRAADIYGVDYEDVEKDIGQNFDPVVRFMAGSMAHELEKANHFIYNAESRLQKRLTEVLLPETFHLPRPAHALAKTKTTDDSVILGETTEFESFSEDDDYSGVAFSPVFPTRILPAEVKILLTEDDISLVSARKRRGYKSGSEVEEVQRIALGIESKKFIQNWQGACLYFDLMSTSLNRRDNAHFMVAMRDVQCHISNRKLNSIAGLPSQEIGLKDHLNGKEKMFSSLRSFYNDNFITFTETDLEKSKMVNCSDFVSKWFSPSSKSEKELEVINAKIKEVKNDELIWLEIILPFPVEVADFHGRFRVSLNVFPVLNRRLNGNGKGEHYFLRNNSIKWVSLSPKEEFLSIRKVYQEKPPEYPEFTFKPFSHFKEERSATYTLRHGGVGRWDEYNAWRRFAYLVNVLKENYKSEELIEQAANTLSIEELHHLLNAKIYKNYIETTPVKDVYVLLQTGIGKSIRARVEYWTSIGEQANGIPAKTGLLCLSKLKSNLEKEKTCLLSTSQDGKKALNSIEQLDALKSTLLSRNRIVTREDLKSFCKSFLNEKVNEISVIDAVGTDQRFNFGMTRVIKVLLEPNKRFQKEDWSGLSRQLQSMIEKRSTSSIPILVDFIEE